MEPERRLRANTVLNYLVVVLAFSMPLYREWVSITAPLITLLWFFDGRVRDKLRALRRHHLSVAVLLFVVYNLASVLWSSEPIEGLAYTFKYRYLLLIPVLATSLRARFRDLALAAFLVGTTLSLMLSFAVFFGLMRFGDAYPGNPSATMSHLDYSMVLAVAALVVFDRMVRSRIDHRSRFAWLGLFVFIVVGLFVNVGRSGQVAFIGTMISMVPIFLVRRSRPAVTLSAVAVIAVVVLGALSIPGLSRRIESAATDLRQTATDQRYSGNLGKRIAGGIVAAEMIRERPMFGTGVGANMVEFRRLVDTRHPNLIDVVRWFPHLHNQYLQVATEVGLVGILLLGYIVYGLFRGPYRRDEDWTIAIVLGCAYLIGWMGDPYLHKQIPMVLFAALAGIVSADGRSLFWNPESSAEPSLANHGIDLGTG
jgi:O-antigen ligase